MQPCPCPCHGTQGSSTANSLLMRPRQPCAAEASQADPNPAQPALPPCNQCHVFMCTNKKKHTANSLDWLCPVPCRRDSAAWQRPTWSWTPSRVLEIYRAGAGLHSTSWEAGRVAKQRQPCLLFWQVQHFGTTKSGIVSAFFSRVSQGLNPTPKKISSSG